MRKYTKLIILSAVLLVIIVLITLAMIFEVDMFFFRNLSITGIQEKKLAVESLIEKQALEETNNSKAKTELQNSKNSFDVAKEAYESIDESTIEMVQEATKEEKYFIEYLWIVLGNYATTNDVAINIVTSGATNTTTNQETSSEDNESPEMDRADSNSATNNNSTSTLKSGVKITIEGRYANVADFVFDVENDKSLRFKLDNIKMTYSGNNKIQATFDVLSLAVLK